MMRKSTLSRIILLLAALVPGLWSASAQEPGRAEAVLRFDQAQRDTVADAPAALSALADTSSRVACKLNRRRVPFSEAYDAVTLWNVRRVKVKRRRMRLSDSTGREQVRLLKFLTERNRRKAIAPHLVGNVAGYTWAGGEETVGRTGRRRYEPVRMNTYSLRADYDSLRRKVGYVQVSWTPQGIWRGLPKDAVYLLDGKLVPGAVLRFIEGLVLRRLDVWNPADGAESAARASALLDSLKGVVPPSAAAPRAVVVGETYPERVPLVLLNGRFTTVDAWLSMCQANAFSASAEVPMYYYYILPAEAVQLYGPRGRYGAVYIDLAE